MVSAYVADLERLVSKPRLDRYRPANHDDLATAVSYLWNVALGEALMQGLATLEIALRNAIHSTLSVHAGTEYWFQAILCPKEMEKVNKVWDILWKRHRRPPTPGKIIAELTFGFWPFLFTKDYHDLWWNNHAALFKAVFPHVPAGLPPKQAVTPRSIHEQIELCANLRNRVMHHEPIFQGVTRLNLARAPLVDVHQAMVAMLGWIDPQLELTLSFVDRFPDVHQNEEARIRAKLTQHFHTS